VCKTFGMNFSCACRKYQINLKVEYVLQSNKSIHVAIYRVSSIKQVTLGRVKIYRISYKILA